MKRLKYLNAMRSLALQAILNAGQGHTGMAISAIPLVYAIYNNMFIDKDHPKWINRDRFILSAGHGSMSLYSLLYFCKLISLDEIKKYRQGCINTAGHPEVSDNNFIDCSTGPLGQGIAHAVGMAIAEKYLNNKWKKLKGLIDHYTYVIVGDGDLQEGICYEAMSLAGKLKLNKLIVLHDSNDYQLDSAVHVVNNEDLKKRMQSQNWIYMKCSNDVDEIDYCIKQAKKNKKPTFIEVKTIIGEGTSCANSNKAHGMKVTKDELNQANIHFDMNYSDFKFDDNIFKHFEQNMIIPGKEAYNNWLVKYQAYQKKYKKLIQNFENSFQSIYTNDALEKIYKDLIKKVDVVPTKTYFKEFFKLTNENKISDILTLSADLASTTNCCNDSECFNINVNSPYIMVGIREFAMAAIQNGILLHGGLKSFCGTFLTFADYMKPAIRLGALNHLPSYYILTHDSYLVGGDGPTHQPYDQLAMIRAIDNVYDIRPANRYEFVAGLKFAFNHHQLTSCFVLSRQNINVPIVKNNEIENCGAYIYKDEKDADFCIIANGSELELVVKNCEAIENEMECKIKIISAVIAKLFLNQQINTIMQMIKSKHGTLVIEASNDANWYKLLKYNKLVLINANSFGASMDGEVLYREKGFNKQNIINKLNVLMKEKYGN